MVYYIVQTVITFKDLIVSLLPVTEIIKNRSSLLAIKSIANRLSGY